MDIQLYFVITKNESEFYGYPKMNYGYKKK